MKNYRAELVGVFGDPVDGNPTCVLEEAGFAALGLNWRYITCRVAVRDLGDAVRALRAIGMRGVNLTMPHKVEVISYLDELSPAARIIGAVNTVINENGRLIGENTDGKGFVRSATDEGISLDGRVVTLLGAGGAARAIGVECALAGARRINVINRNVSRGESVAGTIAENTEAEAVFIPWCKTADIPFDTDILINATSAGFFPNVNECPDIRYEQIRPDMPVCDVVFNPDMTLFLKKAKTKGAHIMTGLGMLTAQGALNFELWTGCRAPYDIMYDALKKEYGG